MHGFIQKVQKQLREHQLLSESDRVVAAVSGGPDSVAMACALAALQVPLHLAYVNHGTRPETETEAAFVATLATRLGAGFSALSCHPASRSEGDMRAARYAALDTLDADRIATAHTASDQAETVLLRMMRGSGTAGLSGIPPQRGRYIRPLLRITRDEVCAYLAQSGQAYCTDPTNASLDPLRNRVRHVLLPLLEEQFQPKIRQVLTRLADVARRDRACLEALAQEHLALHGLAIEPLLGAAPGLWPHVLRACCPVPISEERMMAIGRLLNAREGIVQLEGGLFVRVEGKPSTVVFGSV